MSYFTDFIQQVIHLKHHVPRTTGLYFTNLTLLSADGPSGRSLRVKGERIVGIDTPPEPGDQVINGQGGLLMPGLINAHDHLELNTFARLKYREHYSHSRQWIEDIEARFDTDPSLTEPRRQPLAQRLRISALKNLLSGVTTVCHHNPLHKELYQKYPIRVVKNYNHCHSLFRGDDPLTSYRQSEPEYPWIIHLAEGVDTEAQAEFEQLDQLGLVQGNTVLVHGVGLTPEQRYALIERGGGLIWCPGANQFLFGQTACVAELAQAGKLALGSDSRLTGEFDLLAELQAAQRTGQLSPQKLFETVTIGPARVLRLREGSLGRLQVGGVADLVLLPPATGADPFARLVNLKRAEIELVLLAGKPLVGSVQYQAVFEATRIKFEPVQVDGVAKYLPQRIVTPLRRASVQEAGLALN